jgi:TonB family protein
MRHAVWALAIIGVLVLPLAASIVPKLQLPLWPQASKTAHPLAETIQMSGVVTGWDLKPSRLLSTPEVLMVFWAAGLMLLLTRFLTGSLGVRRLAKAAVAPEDPGWAEMIAELIHSMGCRKRVRVSISAAEVSPMTWGVRRHTILLPMSAEGWPIERRRAVLTHELAHVKRNDGLVHVLVQLASSVYWFNPLIWYAARRERIERERACDDQVLTLGGAPEDYADHLVQVVRALQSSKAFSFAALAMAQPSQLEARVVSILDRRVHREAPPTIFMVVLCALTGLVTLSISAIHVTGATSALTPSQRTHIGNSDATPVSTTVPPQVIATPGPLYAAIEGTVTVEASVDTQGNVRVLRVVKSLGSKIDARAIEAVASWKFTPALKDGVPVAAVTQIDVDFELPPDTGGALRVGGDVKAPIVVKRVEPQYTDEARNVKASGTVVLEAIVRRDGSVDIRQVIHALGYGLDDSAVTAIKQWVFKPATKAGEPVDVALNIEVNFNLR